MTTLCKQLMLRDSKQKKFISHNIKFLHALIHLRTPPSFQVMKMQSLDSGMLEAGLARKNSHHSMNLTINGSLKLNLTKTLITFSFLLHMMEQLNYGI